MFNNYVLNIVNKLEIKFSIAAYIPMLPELPYIKHIE